MSPDSLGSLLGADVTEVRRLGGEATYLRVTDGRELVLKGVPRQQRAEWRPGLAWTELVVLDLLGSEGAPVPKLVAADPHAGWLLRTYEEGEVVGAALQQEAPLPLFLRLTEGLEAIERLLQRFAPELAPHTVRGAQAAWSGMIQTMRGLLTPSAQRAWDELVHEALREDALTLGPLDVNAGNAVWQNEAVCFLDFATIGPDFPERRLAAYGQVARPTPASALTPEAYAHHADERGFLAALRLALFDLLFWAVVLARLLVMEEQPDSPAGAQLRSVWGDPAPLWAGARAQWNRHRLDDARVVAVMQGLNL